jgi:hypothetical protein
MADRYWVGGTGNWSDTAKWAATSGGAGGASVPTAADNAYFDGESDTGSAFIVTVNVPSTCLNLIVGDGVTVTALDQTMTLGVGSTLNVSGSLYFPATNFTRIFNGAINFLATTPGKTITTNGVSLANTINFNGIGGEWTLGSSLTNSANIDFTRGSFNTANYNLSCGTIFNSAVFSLTLGSSTISVSASFNFNVAGNTLDAGTSTIVLSGPTGSFTSLSGLTWYNISFTSTAANGRGVGGNITCNNLTIAGGASTGVTTTTINGNITINGTLTINSGITGQTTRQNIFSNTIGTARTLTCNAITIGDGVDFRDITIAGAAAPFDASANSTGDCGGNSGITFPAPKTVYWNLAGSQNWSSTGWATTPTGTPATANFPLAQDTAVVTEAGAAGTITINTVWNIGTLTFDDGVSTRTSAVTLNFSFTPTFYGDLKLSSGVIISGTGTATFAGRNTQNITGAGKTFTSGITLDSPSGTLVLQDNLTLGTDRTFTLARGTLNLNGKVPSFGKFDSNNSNTRSIVFGSGKIQISGSNDTIYNTFTSTNLTYVNSPIFELTYSGSTGTRTFQNGPATENTNAASVYILSASDAINIASWSGGPNAYQNLYFSNYTGTINVINAILVYGDITLSSGMTFTNTQTTSIGGSSQSLLRTNGVSINGQIIKIGNGTLRLEDNVTLSSTNRFTHTQGTVNLNGRNLSCNDYLTSNSNIRNLTFGSGQILLQGTGTVWNATTSTNMTITPGTGKIVLADNSNTARTFAGGGIQTYPELEFAGDTGTATTTITGSNRFRRLTNSKLVAYTIVFPNATTSVDDWNLNGSEGNLITLSRTGGSGTFTINYSGTSYGIGRYLSISNSAATPANRMYAIFSTDGGSNTGWVFNAPKFGQFLTFFAPPI